MAVQVVPINHPDSYSIVDRAIDEIKRSNLAYEVGPFSTSLEGEYEELVTLIKKIKTASLEAGADELLLNIQIHVKKNNDVTIESKVRKFRN